MMNFTSTETSKLVVDRLVVFQVAIFRIYLVRKLSSFAVCFYFILVFYAYIYCWKNSLSAVFCGMSLQEYEFGEINSLT